MAYVLGFWFADGYMRKEKSYRVLFISNDVSILRAIRVALRSTHPIRHRKKDAACEMSVCSKHLYLQLEKRGGLRCKSTKIRFPKIPQPYLRDFIRGYFDGDGSVFFAHYRSTKDHKMRRELRSNFTSGSIVFLRQLMEILYQKLLMKRKVIGAYNAGHSLKLGYGTRDTSKLLKFMYYPGFPIALQRKAKFIEACKL